MTLSAVDLRLFHFLRLHPPRGVHPLIHPSTPTDTPVALSIHLLIHTYVAISTPSTKAVVVRMHVQASCLPLGGTSPGRVYEHVTPL